MEKINTVVLPEIPAPDTMYRLIPNTQLKFPDYKERVDRNIGIITWDEQNQLKNKVVGIAGCGGMGGYLGMIFARLGIMNIRLADPEVFDVSNLNRQFGATYSTIGKSKAFETARMIHSAFPDVTIEVYPMGIKEEMVSDFVSGCHVMVDEIEIWEYEAPILLHQASRREGIPIFSCNTAGYGTHLFLFTKDSMTLEQVFDVTLEEARVIDNARRKKAMTEEELRKFVTRLLLVIAPELRKYHPEEFMRIFDRLVKEQKASIISTNPTFATGLLADRVLLELVPSLLRKNGIRIPEMPGYVYLDAREIAREIQTKQWW